jgi:hypothetical protein
MIAQNYSHSLDVYSSTLLQGVELNEEEKDAYDFILAKAKAYEEKVSNSFVNKLVRMKQRPIVGLFCLIFSEKLGWIFAKTGVLCEEQSKINSDQLHKEIGHKIEDGISFGVERCNKLAQGRARCNNYAQELISYAEKRNGFKTNDFFDFSVDFGPHDTKRTEVLPLIDQCEKDDGEEGFSVRFSENFKQK